MRADRTDGQKGKLAGLRQRFAAGGAQLPAAVAEGEDPERFPEPGGGYFPAREQDLLFSAAQPDAPAVDMIDDQSVHAAEFDHRISVGGQQDTLSLSRGKSF